MFQSSVYEGALGIIAPRNIGHRSNVRLDVNPLITWPTPCITIVDPHIEFQYVRTVAVTWHSHVIST